MKVWIWIPSCKKWSIELILLRKDGYPCIFFGDYYGIEGPDAREGQQWIIDQLLDIRRDFAYGDQEDYFDHESIVGWIRRGDENNPDGCVVVMSNDEAGEKISPFLAIRSSALRMVKS